MRKEHGLNIGISLFAHKDANIWNNGINQNIGLLALLLKKSEAVDNVFFLNGGDSAEIPATLAFHDLKVPLVWPRDVTQDLDVVIEMGAILPAEWMRHAHACGVRFCCFGVGHNFSATAETLIANKESGITVSDPQLRTETWCLAHHVKTGTSMMETLTRKPVVTMPHLWSPFFIEQTLDEEQGAGKKFGFDPASVGRANGRGWRAGIFEPNISVVKNCFIPLLVCEHAHRQKSDCLDYVMVVNAEGMKNHQTFLRFALNLDITKQQKASYEPRLLFSGAMAEHRLNCVVTHHVECGLNYLYYDALYGGYPLFHNSEYLRDAGMGFYYGEFSAKEGGQAMVEAWDFSADYWQDYGLKAKNYLRSLHPEHPENVRIFSERLLHVANSP